MGGPNLEIFKFGLCLFVPIGLMYYTGLPKFYDKQVKTMEGKLAKNESLLIDIPTTKEEIQDYMQKLIELRQQHKAAEQQR